MNVNDRVLAQSQADVERYRFEQLYKKGVVTDDDIVTLMKQDDNYGITFFDKKYTEKDMYLKRIFRMPYILCDQELSDKVKLLLPKFLKRLYNLQLNEYNHNYLNGEYSVVEYQSLCENLYYKMYESSEDGKSIVETGKAVGMQNKALVFKG